MKNRIPNLSFVLLLLLEFASCKKAELIAPERILIAGGIAANMPYHENYSFAMRDSAGLIANFVFKSEKYGDLQFDEVNSTSDHPIAFEHIEMNFESDLPHYDFGIYLAASNREDGANIISINMNTVGIGFGCHPNRCIGDSNQCIGAMVIGGITYHNVFHQATTFNSDQPEGTSEIWYCTSAGLIRFAQFGGNSWELVP